MRRVVERHRKALEWQALLESGALANQAEIARREGVTRAPSLCSRRSQTEELAVVGDLARPVGAS